MTRVLCMLLLNGSLQNAPGVLIENHGDYWLIQFKRETKEVNANRCLIKGGTK